MAGEVANDVVAEAIRIRLDHSADHRQRPTRLDGLDRTHGCLMRAFDEQSVFLADIAGQESGVGVAVHPVDIGGDVDVHDVTIDNHGRVWDAVADDFIERRTAGLRKAPITQCRRVGAVIDHVIVGDAIKFIGRHTRRHGLACLHEGTGRDAAGQPHLLDHLRRLHPRFIPLGRARPTDILGTINGLGHRQGR